MYIVGRSKLDKANRVNISGLFREQPVKVAVAVDDDKIVIFSEDDERTFGSLISVDDKCRITLQKWAIDAVKADEFYLAYCMNMRLHYLIPIKKDADDLTSTKIS